MRAALIVNNTVVNVIVIDSLDGYVSSVGVETVDLGTIAGGEGGIGWIRSADGAWQPPPAVED